jgi:DNA-binding transcriptional LysR family regulator
MSLTETGSRYFAECCRLLDGLQELERSVSETTTEVTGRLRVNAPVSFGLTVLSPLLPAFLASHPELKIDLTLNDQILDMVGAVLTCRYEFEPNLPTPPWWPGDWPIWSR